MFSKTDTRAFSIIEKALANELEISFCGSKPELSSRYNTNTTPSNDRRSSFYGSADLLNSIYDGGHKMIADIEIDMSLDELKNNEKDYTSTKIGEIFDDDFNLRYTFLQVIEKVGSNYIINNYRLSVVNSKLIRTPVSSTEINRSEYLTMYQEIPASKRAKVIITTLVPVPRFFMSSIKIYDKRVIEPSIQLSNDGQAYEHQKIILFAGVVKYLQEKKLIDMSKKDLSKIIFNPAVIGGRFRNTLSLDDIEIVYNDAPSQEIMVPTRGENIDQINTSRFNRSSYNIIFKKIDGQLKVYTAYDNVTYDIPSETLEEIMPGLAYSKVRFAIGDAIVPEPDQAAKSTEIIFNEFYSSFLEKYKADWDAKKKRFQSLYNPKTMDLVYFTIRYIKKYFLPNLQYTGVPRDLVAGKELAVLNYFDAVYCSSKDFFEIEPSDKYYNFMRSVKGNVYGFSDGRLTDTQRSMSEFIRSSGMHSLIFPSPNTFSLGNNHSIMWRRRPDQSKNYIVVNDSGTKTAWKAKTREYLKQEKRKPRGFLKNFFVVDPDNKFDLAFLEYLSKEDSRFIKYSQFEKTTTVPKISKPADTRISLYYSRDIGTSNISPRKMALDKIPFEKHIVVEYMSSKNVFIYKGVQYISNRVNLITLSRLINQHFKKTLLLVSQSNFKKCSEAKNFYSLEDFMNEDHSKNLPEIQNGFIFIPKHNASAFRTLTEFAAHELFAPFNPNGTDIATHVEDVTDIHYRILGMFSKPIQEIIYRINLEFKVGRAFNAYDVLTATRSNTIVVDLKKETPDFEEMVVNNLVPLDDIKRYGIVADSFSKNMASIQIGSNNHFNIHSYKQDRAKLLKASKHLNLNNKEITVVQKELHETYETRWQIMAAALSKGIK